MSQGRAAGLGSARGAGSSAGTRAAKGAAASSGDSCAGLLTCLSWQLPQGAWLGGQQDLGVSASIETPVSTRPQ